MTENPADNSIRIEPAPPSLRALVYDDLRERIHKGRVTRGARLVDVDLAAEFGISRMPVREALLQLMHEGYLVSTTRGFTLPLLTSQDVADIFEVRRCLEPRAAGLAARDLTDAGIARLTAALARAEAAAGSGDAEALFAANVAFRSEWLAAVRNDRMAQAIARFADQVQTVRLATLVDLPTQAVVVAGMRRLHRAFSRHDSLGAHDEMTRFIEAAEERFVALTQAQESAERQGSA